MTTSNKVYKVLSVVDIMYYKFGIHDALYLHAKVTTESEFWVLGTQCIIATIPIEEYLININNTLYMYDFVSFK